MSLHSCLCFWAQATTCKGCKRDVRFFFHLTDSLEPFSLCIYPRCPERAESHPEQVRGVIGAVGRFCTDARVVTHLKRREKKCLINLELSPELFWRPHFPLCDGQCTYDIKTWAFCILLHFHCFFKASSFFWKRLTLEHLWISNILGVSLGNHCFL